MFRNLFWQFLKFREFNFTDEFEALRHVPYAELKSLFSSSLGDTRPSVDYRVFSTIRLTLSAKACNRFMGTFDLPIDQGDYYLSKLFQFIYGPLAARYRLDAWTFPKARLEEWLDALPAKALPPMQFNWEALYDDITTFELEQIFEKLPGYLGSGTAEYVETPSEVIDRLREHKSIERIAEEADLDVKQVYKIKRGEDVLASTVRKLARALGCTTDVLIPP